MSCLFYTIIFANNWGANNWDANNSGFYLDLMFILLTAFDFQKLSEGLKSQFACLKNKSDDKMGVVLM